MGWLQDALDQLGGSAPVAAPAPIAKPLKPKPEIRHVWFQTRRPVNAADLGEIDLGFYSVADGVLMMRDADGRPTGKEYPLGPNDNARGVAARLAKQAWQKGRGEGDFNRPLQYSTNSFA